MHNRFTEEFLLNTFYFLARENISSTSPLSLVCKEWYTAANKDELWIQLIRDEYKEELKNSGLPAKEFYKQNIKARIDTYYVLGLRNVLIFDVYDANYVPELNDFLKVFPGDCEDKWSVGVCNSFEKALYIADRCTRLSVNPRIQSYCPIFTVQLDCSHLSANKAYEEELIKNWWLTKQHKPQPCDLEIPFKHIKKIYSIFYKSGKISTLNSEFLDAENSHIVKINQNTKILDELWKKRFEEETNERSVNNHQLKCVMT